MSICSLDSLVFKHYRIPTLDVTSVIVMLQHLFCTVSLTLLHSERPKLYAILAFLSAVGLVLKAKKKKN